MVAVADGKVLGVVPLPIAGLMNDLFGSNERESRKPRKFMGRNGLHNTITIHDNGVDSTGMSARITPDK